MAVDLIYGDEARIQEFAANLQAIAAQQMLQVQAGDLKNLARMLMANQDKCSMSEVEGIAFIHTALKTIGNYPGSLTAIEALQEQMLELFEVKSDETR